VAVHPEPQTTNGSGWRRIPSDPQATEGGLGISTMSWIRNRRPRTRASPNNNNGAGRRESNRDSTIVLIPRRQTELGQEEHSMESQGP
jgi:hypothetical protein